MGITNMPDANFSPEFAGYTNQGAFRFWCQKVLPIVYDDSLSYYELLCKIVTYLNNVIKDVSATEVNVEALRNAYEQLQSYVNTYFDSLDVQEEINNKIDEMAASGELSEVIEGVVAGVTTERVDSTLPIVVSEQIGGVVDQQIDEVVHEQIGGAVGQQLPLVVTTWLDNNVDPVGSAVIVDKTLTIDGAAADAQVVGSRFDMLLVWAPIGSFEFGSINPTNGNDMEASNAIRSNLIGGGIPVKCSSGYQFLVYTYEKITHRYVGVYNPVTKEWTTVISPNCFTNYFYRVDDYYEYRFVLTKTDISNITLEDSVNFTALSTDKTLSLENKAADAKATGDAIAEKFTLPSGGSVGQVLVSNGTGGAVWGSGGGGGGDDLNAVHYTPDVNKSDAEKAQARDNIDAASTEDVEAKFTLPSGGTSGQVLVSDGAGGANWGSGGGGGDDSNAVHYTADSGKTDAQKEQARTNIGAANQNDVVVIMQKLGNPVIINGSELEWVRGTINSVGTESMSSYQIRSSSVPITVVSNSKMIYAGPDKEGNADWLCFVCQYDSSNNFISRNALRENGISYEVTLSQNTKSVRFCFGHASSSATPVTVDKAGICVVQYGEDTLQIMQNNIGKNSENIDKLAETCRVATSFTFTKYKTIGVNGALTDSSYYGATDYNIPIYPNMGVKYSGAVSGGNAPYAVVMGVYDENGAFLYRDVDLADGKVRTLSALASYVKFAFGHLTSSGVAWNDAFADDFSISLSFPFVENSDFEHQDVPKNPGVRNAIMNFKQLAEISYKNSDATIPYNTYADAQYVAANADMKGILYSSSRPENGFVPNFVSFETYLSAVASPRSYLHTIDLTNEYSGQANGHSYYGCVCSSSVAYALNLFGLEPTVNWGDIDGMELLPVQELEWLELCDLICTQASGHVVMVGDIVRNNRGTIKYVTIYEAASPYVVATRYTLEQLKTRFPNTSWAYYRYAYLDTVRHTQSPFVSVEDETAQSYTLNTDIVPKKGDKCNYRTNESVELDCYGDSWNSVEILKNEAAYSTVQFASTISLGVMDAGHYKARLVGNNNTSEWCEWIVVNAAGTPVDASNTGEVEVSFTPTVSGLAKPTMIMWVYPVTGSKPRAFLHTTKISDTDAANGSAISSYQTGLYGLRVGYQTDFGVIFSPIVEITVT